MTTQEKPLSVGRQVKAILQQNKITMKDLAPKVGYSREHLNRLLNSGDVTEDLINAIEAATGVHIHDLLSSESAQRQSGNDEVLKLQKELEDARATISNLSAALRAIAEKK